MGYSDNFFSQMSNIDGRAEFERLLYGDITLPGIGRPVLLRRLKDQHCACWDDLTGGPIAYCSYCLGEGYQFSEEDIKMYIADGTAPLYKPGTFGGGQYPLDRWGQSDASKAVGYCSWDIFPDYERYTLKDQKRYDKVLLLKVDENGDEVFPQVITQKFKVMNVIPRHGDFGRVEFIELNLEKEDL